MRQLRHAQVPAALDQQKYPPFFPRKIPSAYGHSSPESTRDWLEQSPQTAGSLPVSNGDGLIPFLRECTFLLTKESEPGICAAHPCRKGNALPSCYQHALGVLYCLGFAFVFAPFLTLSYNFYVVQAGLKLSSSSSLHLPNIRTTAMCHHT